MKLLKEINSRILVKIKSKGSQKKKKRKMLKF